MISEESSFFTESMQVAMPNGIDGIGLLFESTAGAFRIYVARHLGRKVVLKGLKPNRQTDVVALTQLHKEYALGFMVDSPAVCRTLAWHSLPDGIGPVIEMEYCEGISLRSLIDHGRILQPELIEAIITRTLEALITIHAAGVVHRDIKPANIIVDCIRMSAKVIDFGCADTADYALLKSPAGTPLYTPAEKQSGNPTPLATDDLYALGVTISELAALVSNRRDAAILRRFGHDLCSRRYATAYRAIEAFRKASADKYKTLRRTLGCAAGAMLAAIAISVFLKEDNAPADTYVAVEVQPAPTQTVIEKKKLETDPKSVKSAAEHPKSSKSKIEPLTDPATLADELELEQYTLATGPLLAKSQAGLTTPTEEADAEVIRFADSLYRTDMIELYQGKTFTHDTMRIMAAEHTNHYEPLLYQRFPDTPPGYDPARRRAILRGRIIANLTTYHTRPTW